MKVTIYNAALQCLTILVQGRTIFNHEDPNQHILDAPISYPDPEFNPFSNIIPLDAAAPTQGVRAKDRSTWTAICSSAQPDCKNILDGNVFSSWRSGPNNAPPHTLTLDMKVIFVVGGVSMLPLRDAKMEGNVAVHEVWVSVDGVDWGQPVAYGTWWGDNTENFAVFEPVRARFVRLVAKTTALAENFVVVADFNVFIRENFNPPALDPAKGQWGVTIDFPLVPAAAWVEPLTGKVVTFSSYDNDRFDDNRGRDPKKQSRTLTATWDPASKQVSQRIVGETQHDMFCPGMSLDATGKLIVTGGRTNTRTSVYDAGTWSRSTEMIMHRGYQSSVTCADGRIFVIGGSWESIGGPAPDQGCDPKDAEIYDPVAKTWTMLPKSLSKPMLTGETNGFRGCATFRSDNHAWLFPWKKNTVFQAGPSKAMNWYTTTTPGGQVAAGNRADDDHAMCGVAVMYDALAGKILTTGGSRTYGDNAATSNAYILTLTSANINATVPAVKTPSMGLTRIYHSGILLPTGQTLIVGGRLTGGIFLDDKAALESELYTPSDDPAKAIWTRLAAYSTPRTYHSFALLLPDATVLVGGGGLCVPGGSCSNPPRPAVNHFDAQLFTPPYLFDKTSGKLAARPTILTKTIPNIRAGESFLVDVDANGPVPVEASLVRYGSATHGLNTDQRRVPVKPVATGVKGQWRFDVPGEEGVVIPGYWMLFLVDGRGVPSKALNVLVRL